ncbi:MAG: hypothetical protein LBL07_02780 [Tannerella sp.]|nr:hypothetical protein [Tannerella sp.]
MEDLRRRSDRQELCRCLNDMVLRNQHPICDNPYIIELANHYYQKTVESNRLTPVRETEASSQKETERRKQEEVTVKLSTLTNLARAQYNTHTKRYRTKKREETTVSAVKIDEFILYYF